MIACFFSWYADILSLSFSSNTTPLITPSRSQRTFFSESFISDIPYNVEKKNSVERKKDISRNVINWRKRKKIELIEYKGGKCEICGYKKSTWSLEFHHKDPNEKDFEISGKSWSFERLKKEVDKCILVCSNCHHEIHEKINSDNTL